MNIYLVTAPAGFLEQVLPAWTSNGICTERLGEGGMESGTKEETDFASCPHFGFWPRTYQFYLHVWKTAIPAFGVWWVLLLLDFCSFGFVCFNFSSIRPSLKRLDAEELSAVLSSPLLSPPALFCLFQRVFHQGTVMISCRKGL